MCLRVDTEYHAYEVESAIHEMFAHERLSGEWYKEDGVIDWLRHGQLNVAGWKFENATW